MTRLLLVTTIPVHSAASGLRVLDLWARDLEAQMAAVDAVTVVAPRRMAEAGSDVAWPEGIAWIDEATCRGPDHAAELASAHDLVQVAGGEPARRASLATRFAAAARASKRPFVVSLSSDRARTGILNARGQGMLRRVRAWLDARSIRATDERLVSDAAGLLLTGHGLVGRAPHHANVHVGTASWIQAGDVLTTEALTARAEEVAGAGRLELVAAARLEPMKGIHLAIDALKILADRPEDSGVQPYLTILGEGPAKDDLENQARDAGLSDRLSFGGTRAYPDAFLEELSRHHLLLVTNLNVEQPRVVFDALAAGVLPLCPDSPPYRALGLDERLLYPVGDAEGLAAAIRRFDEERGLFESLLPDLREWALENTVDSMHRRRAEWIRETILVPKLP